MSLTLRFAARSDRGLLRDGNEDSVYAGPRLLAVADGVGGHAAGEVASKIAISLLAPLDDDPPGGDLLDALQAATLSANRHLSDMVAGDPTLEGMGTTLTALLSAGSRLGLVHIGDSRAYLLRDGELTQITHDHTLVQMLVDEGRLRPDEADSHPQRNVITRSLDGRGEIQLDLSVREARAGDRYLLCTDGLSGVVSADTMRDALALPDPHAATDRLVELALRGGAPDNVTVIVADVLDSDGVESGEPVVAGAAADFPAGEGPGPSADTSAGRAALARPGRLTRILPADPSASAAPSNGYAAGPSASRPSDGQAAEHVDGVGDPRGGRVTTAPRDAPVSPGQRDGQPGREHTGPGAPARAPRGSGSAAENVPAARPGRAWRRVRALLALLAVLALLAGAGYGGWAYTQTQRYVGVASDEVAVYRGIRGSVLGVELSSVQERSGMPVADLQPFARQQVQDGIPAHSSEDAKRILDRLRASRLPECPRTRVAPAATAVPGEDCRAVSE